ncbi:TauD/TfdA family dioxygenase [Dictyobacter formicarum]|uniref:SyrP protein n=1 Tax=Dictyobacter formicarum TaxID=2778368 RepID=A0ABQ3VJT0_9CHLR|nr:TauD/TfdA family dioxygenase [Dictyobacter formicarum]GHO86472.1 syrP protein [Dictyobacter formicarum]
METRPSIRNSIRKSIQERREETKPGNITLTKSSYLAPELTLPLVLEPTMMGVNLATWATHNREYVQKELNKHGAILFRNFAIDSPDKFENVARSIAIDGELFDEYGDLPRDTPGSKVYHSTPYPADKSILFHNESSHMHRWPMKIFFYCVKPADGLGATPILDCRKTYEQLDPAIIRRMQEKKLLYVRNFIDGLDVSWQQFFGTTNKLNVEAYCRKAGVAFEWKGENRLTTRQISPAVVLHPQTGEPLFFNQIQLHHISCLDPDVKESMLSMFSAEDLPRNVLYGDGTPIEDSIVNEISAIYDRLAVRFQWQKGDVIMLDNMMVAHARDPFEGTRKILVAMAEMVSQKAILDKSSPQ